MTGEPGSHLAAGASCSQHGLDAEFELSAAPVQRELGKRIS